MEFKLGASLWAGNTGLDSRSQLQGQEPAGDFEKKLGLANGAQEQPGDSREPAHEDPSTEFGSTAKWLASERLQGIGRTVDKVALAELYPLGAMAGHHMSHLPESFLDQQGKAFAAVQECAAEQGDRAPTAHLPLVDDGQVSAGKASPVPVAYQRVEAEAAPAAKLEQGELATFLATRWPERRCLVLPREAGSEILIRDFHLSQEEQQTLAADLLRLLRDGDRPLQQIWVNGRSLWQRDALTGNDREVSHGS